MIHPYHPVVLACGQLEAQIDVLVSFISSGRDIILKIIDDFIIIYFFIPPNNMKTSGAYKGVIPSCSLFYEYIPIIRPGEHLQFKVAEMAVDFFNFRINKQYLSLTTLLLESPWRQPMLLAGAKRGKLGTSAYIYIYVCVCLVRGYSMATLHHQGRFNRLEPPKKYQSATQVEGTPTPCALFFLKETLH